MQINMLEKLCYVQSKLYDKKKLITLYSHTVLYDKTFQVKKIIGWDTFMIHTPMQVCIYDGKTYTAVDYCSLHLSHVRRA